MAGATAPAHVASADAGGCRLAEQDAANTRERQHDGQDIGLAEALRQRLPMTPVQMALEVHQGFKFSISLLQ